MIDNILNKCPNEKQKNKDPIPPTNSDCIIHIGYKNATKDHE